MFGFLKQSMNRLEPNRMLKLKNILLILFLSGILGVPIIKKKLLLWMIQKSLK